MTTLDSLIPTESTPLVAVNNRRQGSKLLNTPLKHNHMLSLILFLYIHLGRRPRFAKLAAEAVKKVRRTRVVGASARSLNLACFGMNNLKLGLILGLN